MSPVSYRISVYGITSPQGWVHWWVEPTTLARVVVIESTSLSTRWGGAGEGSPLYETLLISLKTPFRLLVIADWNEDNPRIITAKMDGSTVLPVVREGLHYPNGVTLDREDLRIYWVDAFLDKIESATYDGRDRITHVDHLLSDSFHPYAILYFNGFIFWSNVLNDTIHQAKVVENTLVNHLILRENIRLPSQFQIVSDSHVRPGGKPYHTLSGKDRHARPYFIW